MWKCVCDSLSSVAINFKHDCPDPLVSILQDLGMHSLIHNVHDALVLPCKTQTNHQFPLRSDTGEWIMTHGSLKFRDRNEYECLNIALLKILSVRPVTIMLPRFNNEG